MAGKALLYDISTLDFDNPVADLEAIRQCNAQRFEMEQLTAIVYADPQAKICVGYKDVTDEEFWVRGHMPGMPLMPGVIMLEAAAQLCSYFAIQFDLLGTKMLGFGGLEEVHFRDTVLPGNRLVLIAKFLKARRNRMMVSAFQGVVGESVVVDGVIKGIPIPVDALPKTEGGQ